MRELNTVEVAEVSGAGLFADIGGTIGSVVGGLINQGAAMVGITADTTAASAQIGTGIGSWFEMNFGNATNEISAGLVKFAFAGIDAITQLFNK